MTETQAEKLVKSKQRVADHGEVFTPAWMVQDMLDLVRSESERIESRVLEPACGSGNFLVEVLRRKLAAVERRHGKSDFEKRHYALLALMCTYGIELLEDNAAECRANLVEIFLAYLEVPADDVWARAALAVTEINIVQADALSMNSHSGNPITFAEWAYLGRGKYQRRDFPYDRLTQRSKWDAADSLFGGFADQLFEPSQTYPTATVEGIAGMKEAP